MLSDMGRILKAMPNREGEPPDQVASQDVSASARGKGLSGKEPSRVAIGAEMACLMTSPPLRAGDLSLVAGVAIPWA